MIKYFKNIEDNYIISISTGSGIEKITQEEYDNILSVIHNRPIPKTGYDYKLRTDLTWETVEVEAALEETEILDDEVVE